MNLLLSHPRVPKTSFFWNDVCLPVSMLTRKRKDPGNWNLVWDIYIRIGYLDQILNPIGQQEEVQKCLLDSLQHTTNLNPKLPLLCKWTRKSRGEESLRDESCDCESHRDCSLE
ncbi:hypothetical protein AVEN_210107-1 [Araneus ventricosus]|uniref:Uncharacterized protein n=1 Tax=Araneus ventricosus TaxID=182803 RepID=A0A4Y2GBF4_ARAVE|nr:hypothetical protein AVEN_210107-1 [Araneus ventricosus]